MSFVYLMNTVSLSLSPTSLGGTARSKREALNDNALIFSGDKYLWINETSLFKRCYLSIDRDESEELKNYKYVGGAYTPGDKAM